MKEKTKECFSYVMFIVVAIVLVSVSITASLIRTKHPDWTGTQVMIKMFIWDYEGE